MWWCCILQEYLYRCLSTSFYPFDANLAFFCTRYYRRVWIHLHLTWLSQSSGIWFLQYIDQHAEHLFDHSSLFSSHESLEKGRSSYEDETLSGMLQLCAAVVRQNPSFKDSDKSLVSFCQFTCETQWLLARTCQRAGKFSWRECSSIGNTFIL